MMSNALIWCKWERLRLLSQSQWRQGFVVNNYRAGGGMTRRQSTRRVSAISGNLFAGTSHTWSLYRWLLRAGRRQFGVIEWLGVRMGWLGKARRRWVRLRMFGITRLVKLLRFRSAERRIRSCVVHFSDFTR